MKCRLDFADPQSGQWVDIIDHSSIIDHLVILEFVVSIKLSKFYQNIARGTTDPEIDSVTWIKLGNNMAPLTLVANLATRWRHLH